MRRRVVVDAVDEGGALDAVSDRASRMFPGHFRMDVEKVEDAAPGSSPGVISSAELRSFGMLAALIETTAYTRRLAELRRVEWAVYAKRPFAGPAAVLAYLGRYTHCVAISKSRLVAFAGSRVSFRFR